MKIAVLAGGWSPEREVSLTSGALIANALIQNGHQVALIDVYKGVPDLCKVASPTGHTPDPTASVDLALLNGCFHTTPYPTHRIGAVEPELSLLRTECGNGDALIGPNVIAICQAADLTFLAMHGGMGENGQLQATLDSFGIRYTGSGYDGCLISMNKDLSKRLLLTAGIRTPDWVCLNAGTPTEQSLEIILSKIGIPCVVKPCGCGSSVGVTIVETTAELETALLEAERYGSSILVEKKITGRELTVGVLGDHALPVVEILPPKDAFYDYKNKYSGNTVELCPAPIPATAQAAAQSAAITGMQALRLSGYARFDFIMDENNDVYCLEANALPGMTPSSLFPLAARTEGISYEELCERMLDLAKQKISGIL